VKKSEKIVSRLKSKPNNFTYNELKIVLQGRYVDINLGKTAASRVGFINNANSHLIRLHKSQPANILKSYQLELILEELTKRSLIE